MKFNPKATTKPPEYREPAAEKVLRCWNEFWTAEARWRRREGIWVCVESADIIRWMRKMSPEAAKLNLARRGCAWEWI